MGAVDPIHIPMQHMHPSRRAAACMSYTAGRCQACTAKYHSLGMRNIREPTIMKVNEDPRNWILTKGAISVSKVAPAQM